MNRQKGASSTGIMVGIALLAVALTVGLPIIPLYMNNMSLNQAIDSAASSNFQQMSTSEIRERLQKVFRINGIKINPRDFDIKKTDTVTELTYTHEDRVNVFSNIDAVVTFTNYYSTADY